MEQPCYCDVRWCEKKKEHDVSYNNNTSLVCFFVWTYATNLLLTDIYTYVIYFLSLNDLKCICSKHTIRCYPNALTLSQRGS